jgi:hypothetical protein
MRIAVSTGTLNIVMLHRDAFTGDFIPSIYVPPDEQLAASWDELFAEKHDTEDLVRQALSKRWREYDEFEVGWDENYALTLCGGIYSARIMCKEYLEVLHGVLRSTRHCEQWAYSTAIELTTPVDGMKYCHFILQGDQITVENWDLDHFDFLEYFSRSCK